MVIQCSLTSQILLFVKKDKQNDNRQRKKNRGENKQIKIGIIVPTMNHYSRNGLEGDPEFSTR